MSACIRASLDGLTQPHWIGTFHRLGARQIRAELVAAGLRPDFEILHADEGRRLFRDTTKAMGLASAGDGTAGHDSAKLTSHRLARFKDNLWSLTKKQQRASKA
jgi:DNA helicase II / ATP-dependent DNA helicase PcrA